MPRDGSGIYSRPPGTNAVPDTTIESTKYNANVADVETDLNAPRPIIAGGTGASSAAAARTNLGAEAAEIQVTNYDTHAFVAGSFWSLAGATGAPNGTDVFAGYCTRVNDGVLPDKFTLTARSRVSNVVYYRQKATGVWGAWAIDGAADYVNVTGDTMTGALAISSTTPSTSSTTGALTVAGGVGVAHGITSGYDITATQTYSGFPNRGSIVFGNSGKYLHYSDSSNYFLLGGARLFVSDATASTSPTTGSLTLAGGAGIGGAIWCNAVNINNWTMPANSAALRIGSNNANGASIVTRPSADGGTAMQFENFNGGIVGSIGTSASNTSFNTSSDMRLKDDLKSFDAGNIVDDTNVYDFAWKSTGERSYGVIAQQAQEVYPAAVTYEQKQDWWGIDYSKYVPVILQELKALRARVAELEGRTDTKPPPS